MFLKRRAALQMGLAASAALCLPARAQQSATRVSVALDWTPNTNHVGLFVARDQGFYKDAGLDVEILPYGDTSAGALVSNGVADFGVVGTISLLTQRAAGADLKAVYAVVQIETGRLVFNADRKDIQSPKNLDGLTYAGFGSQWENALIGTMIRNDGGKGEFTTVTLGTSAYEALANGKVDFTLEVYTWEGVKAELENRAPRAFRYADYGVPDEHTTLLASSDAYLAKNPEAAKAFVQATQKGYALAMADPAQAARLLIAANKDALTDPALIDASLKALIDGHYLARKDGVVGEMDPAKFQAMSEFMVRNQILRDKDGQVLTAAPDSANIFTNSFFAGA